MDTKKITIILLSDGSRKIIQLKIPKLFFLFFFLLCLSATLAIAWVMRDYRSIKMQIPQLAQLEKENNQQRAQLVSLAHKIDQINGKMIELKKFDHKLKVMVNLETDEEQSQFLGIGGSDLGLLNPDYNLEKAHKKLVRLMHQSFDTLNNAISIHTIKKAELYSFLENQKSILASTPSIWPTKG